MKEQKTRFLNVRITEHVYAQIMKRVSDRKRTGASGRSARDVIQEILDREFVKKEL